VTPLERRCRWLLRAYPAWYRHKRAGEMLDTLLQASPPGRTWPSARDARALITGGLRVRGWVWFLSMLWVTAGAGYALLMAANTYTNSGSLFPETGVPVVVDAVCWLPVLAWGLLPVPVLVAGFVRLRGWWPRNWLRAALWAGTWITGFALMNEAMVWAGDWFPGYGYPVENLGELGICAAWLGLGAAMTWIVAVPAHHRDVPGTSRHPSSNPSRWPPGAGDVRA
jgi:hypothetical protein